MLLGLLAPLALISTAAWGSMALHGAWFGACERVFVAGLIVAVGVAALGVARGEVGLRVWLAALMALAPLAYALADFSGHGLAYPVYESAAIAWLAALVCSVGAVGLVLRRSWARWLALAAALSGLGTSGLNIISSLAHPDAQTWVYALTLTYSAIVGLALVGPSVRAQFESEGADGLWSSRELSVRSVRGAVLSQLVAIPMLMVYAWVQPVVPETKNAALVLAVVLGAAALLSMGRKLSGALLLSLGGPALLVLTALSAWLAHVEGEGRELAIIGYYACFWIPAGLVSTFAGVVLARPVLRLWRQLD